MVEVRFLGVGEPKPKRVIRVPLGLVSYLQATPLIVILGASFCCRS